VSPVEWAEGDAAPESVSPTSGWPSRIGGYAKLIAAAVSTLGATGVLTWLQEAGVTHLPSWGTALITAGVGIIGVLFGPRNKA
jgi:hypothetical protein